MIAATWKRILLVFAVLGVVGTAAAFTGRNLPGPGRTGLPVKCGNLGKCGGAASGFPKSAFVFVAAGNSLALGTDSTSPWPTQLSTMLTASGVSYIMNNIGRGGYATEYLADRANFSLTYKIPTDVDPLYDATKNNVLIFQEVINDLYYGSTGAQAYANLRTYMQTLAQSGWYKIVVMPTPRDNPGVTQPTYENERQNFITLVNADPTFGGYVNAVWRVDQDTRLGSASSDSDGYYYYLSGGADTKVHWLFTADAIAASAIMDLLRQKDSTKFPFKPQYMPFPGAIFSSAKAGSVLASSGGPATDGQTVATWVHDGSLESGNIALTSGTPSYSTTGFGGQPAITLAASSHLTTAGNVTTGRGTIAITFKASVGGFAVWGNNGSGDRRLYASEVGGTYGTTSYEAAGATFAQHNAAAGTVVTNTPHVMVMTFDGTLANQKVYLDGTLIGGTTGTNGDPGATILAQVFHVGHPGSAFVGSIGEVLMSQIPASDTERKRLETYLGALRNITVAP